MQISPSNTAVGLTRQGPGADRGEPDKYYPTGLRSYARVIPNDVVQGAASAALLKQLGAKRVLVVHDGEVYGRGVSRAAVKRLRALGVRITGFRALGRAGRRAGAIARAARSADAVFYGGITANGAPRLWKALARSKRTLKLVGSDGVAESGFTERIPRSVAARTYVMVATLAREAYPAAGQGVFDRLGANPDPYALYGYEAMALALDAINRGGPTKQGAIEALYATQDRDSVLGRYSIDDRGDTTLGTLRGVPHRPGRAGLRPGRRRGHRLSVGYTPPPRCPSRRPIAARRSASSSPGRARSRCATP
jgi:branched-chain amino acid transport system substrate-binding protein